MVGNNIPVPHTSSVMGLYKEFGENTTMHGLHRVCASRSPCRRIVWSMMVVFGLGFAIFQVVDLIMDFYSYPVTTVVRMEHETKIRFPAITICNINRKRRSLSPEIERLPRKMEFEGVGMEAIINIWMKAYSTDSETKSTHQLSDMLLKCLINKHLCSKDNFTEIETTSFGGCYTFTTKDPGLMYTTKPGPQNGLILELDIEHRDYIFLTPTAGLKVIVHEHDHMPFPEEGGVLAQPGVTTGIGIKKRITRQLPSPYGNCVSASSTDIQHLSIFSGQQYAYSENTCRKSCYQLALFKRCNCCDEDLPCNNDGLFKMAGIILTENRTVPYCNIRDALNADCILDVQTDFMTDGLHCFKRCFPACDQITYETVVSTALWPSDPYLDVVLHKVNETVLKNMTFESKSSLKRFIQTNFLRLEIYFDSLDFMEFVTQPKYSRRMLLGDIGGHLGLWLGFSILTAMEIIELLIDNVLFWIRNRNKKDTATNENRCEENV